MAIFPGIRKRDVQARARVTGQSIRSAASSLASARITAKKPSSTSTVTVAQPRAESVMGILPITLPAQKTPVTIPRSSPPVIRDPFDLGPLFTGDFTVAGLARDRITRPTAHMLTPPPGRAVTPPTSMQPHDTTIAGWLRDLFTSTPGEREKKMRTDFEEQGLLERFGFFESEAERRFRNLEEQQQRAELLGGKAREASEELLRLQAAARELQRRTLEAEPAIAAVSDSGFFEKNKKYIVLAGLAVLAVFALPPIIRALKKR